MHGQDYQTKRRHSNVEVSSVGSSDSLGLLNGEAKGLDGHQPRWLQHHPIWLQKPVEFVHSKSRRFWAIVGAGVLLLIIFSSAASRPAAPPSGAGIIKRPGSVSTTTVEDRNLYILIPKSHTDISTCKTILSAAILNYPTVWLVDWDPALDAADKSRERGLKRLSNIRKYLFSLDRKRQDDAVLILDEPSTWFQLRPEVLLQRWHDLNDDATRKLERMFGGSSEALDTLHMGQNIVFTAQRQCAANLTGAPICNAAPQAPEPLGTRYLGHGVQLGSVRHLKTLYDAAAARAEQDPAFASVHTLFTTLFGEQEQQRKHFADGNWAALLAARNATNDTLPGEFRIHLDYAGQLSFPTSTPVNELAFLSHTGAPPAADSAPLPADIQASMPPFWTQAGDGSAGLPDATSWANLSLLTNVHSHAVPAMIHVDAASVLNWWEQLWMQPYARKLFDAFAILQDMPNAVIVDPRSRHDVRYWAPSFSKPGIKATNLDFTRWDDVCGSDQDATVLFADGKGKWRNPHF